MHTTSKLPTARWQRASGPLPSAQGRPQRLAVSPVIKDAGHQHTDSNLPLEDPEKPFRQFGPKFGGRYTLSNPMRWLNEAPRVRVRSPEDRKLEELLEVAVLNERLSGGLPSWEARRRLEYLKLRRRNWEAIYHYISETDAVATLALIEEANRKVTLGQHADGAACCARLQCAVPAQPGASQ